jgi:peptide deformylase
MKTAASKYLISLPNKHLRERSHKVGLITKEIVDIIKKMEITTLDWEDSRQYEVGVALAAVQIDKLYRIVIVRNDFENKDSRSFTVFINPVITKYEGKLVEDYEGCLSVKDIYGRVPRYEKVKVKAIGIDGKEFRVTATGFLARVLQHEVDHTNGKLFIDHIKDEPSAFYTLNSKGQLKELDYDKKIKQSSILW